VALIGHTRGFLIVPILRFHLAFQTDALVRLNLSHENRLTLETRMANSQTNQPADGSNPQPQEKPASSALGLAKFAALIAGLMALAYVLMKVLSVVWPE
jgi:hypothetical protein